jgi:NADP-dependent 3-hydroxy acid dehydrogenase YdfG
MSKVIVITGATGGVGEEMVRLFLSKNWTVIGLARDYEKLKLLSSSLNNERFTGYETDIRDINSVSQSFAGIAETFGKIDMLVNNASIFKQKPFWKFSTEEIHDIIDTNLKGTIFCTLEGVKLMSTGRIVNIGSVSGIHGIANQSIYSASKYAVNGFSESLNQELIKDGILISTIIPGGIDTPLWNEQNKYDGDVSELLTPRDIANLTYYISNLPSNVVMKTATIFPTCEWH